MLDRKIILNVALIIFAVSAESRSEEIQIVADVYMPYTGDSSKNETGFMVDIAKAIWEKNGNTVVYETKSWNEALDSTRSGDSLAIVGANRQDAPDFLYPKIEEAQAQGVFYALSSSSFKYDGPESLSKVRLGIIADYKYNPEIAAYIKQNHNTPYRIQALESGPDILDKFFSHLSLKSIDTFIEDRNVIKYFLKHYDDRDNFVECGALRSVTPLYIAVSPRALDGDTLTQELTDGMADLRSSGALKTILAKYGLTDWADDSSAKQ